MERIAAFRAEEIAEQKYAAFLKVYRKAGVCVEILKGQSKVLDGVDVRIGKYHHYHHQTGTEYKGTTISTHPTEEESTSHHGAQTAY